MRTLYQASNSVDAHMILNLLEQEGLAGRVDGEYLQGGIGELPAAGLVRVMVSEEDYPAARRIVERWDAAQPEQAPVPAPKRPANRLGTLAFGFILGILATYSYYRAPVSNSGMDHNQDGVIDDNVHFSPSGHMIRNEIDRNFDGRVDYVSIHGKNGVVETIESDDDFDGTFETRITYSRGNPRLAETDTDGDGYRDFTTHFENGVAVSGKYILPSTGAPQKIDYYSLGKLTHSDKDSDLDGRMDTRTRYNALGEITSIERIE